MVVSRHAMDAGKLDSREIWKFTTVRGIAFPMPTGIVGLHAPIVAVEIHTSTIPITGMIIFARRVGSNVLIALPSLKAMLAIAQVALMVRWNTTGTLTRTLGWVVVTRIITLVSS